MTPKGHFEIIWPLEQKTKISADNNNTNKQLTLNTQSMHLKILWRTKVLYMSFDRFLLAVESRDLSQADKSLIRVSSSLLRLMILRRFFRELGQSNSVFNLTFSTLFPVPLHFHWLHFRAVGTHRSVITKKTDVYKKLMICNLSHIIKNDACTLGQRLLNRWTSQLDLGCTTGCLERVVSVHNST